MLLAASRGPNGGDQRPRIPSSGPDRGRAASRTGSGDEAEPGAERRDKPEGGGEAGRHRSRRWTRSGPGVLHPFALDRAILAHARALSSTACGSLSAVPTLPPSSKATPTAAARPNTRRAQSQPAETSRIPHARGIARARMTVRAFGERGRWQLELEQTPTGATAESRYTSQPSPMLVHETPLIRCGSPRSSGHFSLRRRVPPGAPSPRRRTPSGSPLSLPAPRAPAQGGRSTRSFRRACPPAVESHPPTPPPFLPITIGPPARAGERVRNACRRRARARAGHADVERELVRLAPSAPTWR